MQSHQSKELTFSEALELEEKLRKERRDSVKTQIKEAIKYAALSSLFQEDILIDTALKINRKELMREAIGELLEEGEL